ncbi:hypothetical protein HFO71_24185 [Rhizobium laguerreae]|uniref:hypothetical protein n=1 Tax=Rhizobium laguerreae TaxID=1076926 RepID=UPI001C8FFF30|nr:hypothetical protein [Rhizobium laguerreae]MBY3073416.1 hypothetical protein [Rhizobium laguerreae]
MNVQAEANTFTTAQIVALNMRLGKNAKAAPTERRKTIFVHVRPDADYHVDAWKAWQCINNPATLPLPFIKAHCRIVGIEYATLLRHRGRGTQKLWPFRKWLMHEVAARYPRLSTPKIGILFDRHWTTVLYAFGRTSTARQRMAS